MGECRHCGREAGFLRPQHPECTAQHERRSPQTLDLARQAACGRISLGVLRARVNELASSHVIGPSEIRDVYIQGWEAAASHLLADGVLSVDEEHHLAEFMDHFGLSQAELDRHGMHSKVAKAAVLRDLMQGKLPQRIKVAGGLPFSLLKTEHLIWLFTDVGYLEDQVRREYVGRSSGLSIRLAKGVYYRVGAFRGHPVTKTDRVHVDTGLLGVTNKHLYFAGPLKSFRVRHDKIVSIMPFSDGAGIV